MICKVCGKKIIGKYVVRVRTVGVVEERVPFEPIRLPYYRRKVYFHKQCLSNVRDVKKLGKALKRLWEPTYRDYALGKTHVFAEKIAEPEPVRIRVPKLFERYPMGLEKWRLH